jgi:eukaryotic-like serine/threonine-protein kinase
MPPDAPEPDDANSTAASPSRDAVKEPTRSLPNPAVPFLEPLPGWQRDLKLGDVLDDRYTIVERVGVGGMGIVYKAIDQRLRQPVAIKQLDPLVMSDSGEARFRRELVLAKRVSHPNVCRLHDIGGVDGQLYISMDFVEGQRLDHLIASIGHLSPKQTAYLGKQLCAGLAAIHEQGIVHRDLKPSNVMIDRSGQLLIMDFGLAIQPGGDDHLTSENAVVGTMAYMSPEQARGQNVGPQSDIFAVGLILYEALTGCRAPGDKASLPLSLRDASERCPPPSEHEAGVPPSLDAVVMRCLARNPAERFGNAAEAGAALDAVHGTLSGAAGSRGWLSAQTVFTHFQRLARARIGLGLLFGLVLLTALGTWRWLAPRKVEPTEPGRPLTLAVMPFAYSGPDDHAYLRNLLPLLITERLRESADVTAAPFSVTHALGPTEDAASVTRQLGVDTVIYGTLKEHDGRLEMAIEVRRPESPGSIWSGTAHHDAGSLIPRTEQLSDEIAEALGVRAHKLPNATSGPNQKAFALYIQGRSLLEGWDIEGNEQRAIEVLRQAIEIDEGFAAAHAALAMALWRHYENRHDPSVVKRALAESQRAVSLAPMLPEAQLALGTVQLGMAQSAEATVAFEKAQWLAPGDDSITRAIGAAYASRGRDDDAERMFQRAIDLRPAFWENYNAKATFLVRKGRDDEARPLFRKVIELRPQGDLGYANLAILDLVAGDLDTAQPLLEAALRIRPSTRSYRVLGFIHYARGRFAEAATAYEKALSGDAEPGDYGNLGDALRQQQRVPEARSAYEKAIALAEAHLRVNPDDVNQRGGLAMWLAAVGRCDDAREATRAAVAKTPLASMIFYYAAQAAALCHDTTGATDYALKASAAGATADIQTSPDLVPVLQSTARGRQLLEELKGKQSRVGASRR